MTNVARAPVVPVRSIVCFYVLAVALSAPAFLWRALDPASFAALPIPRELLFLTYMWGPGLAALVTTWLFGSFTSLRRALFGQQVARSLAFYWVPLVALAAVGVPGDGDALRHLDVLFPLGLIGFVGVLGEELGWRGFLQDAMRPVSPWLRYLVIGLMWEAWHLRPLTMGEAPLLGLLLRVVITLAVVVALAAIIGAATERTRSLSVAVTLHSWVNLCLGDYPGPRTYAVAAFAVVFWMLLLRRWPVPDTGPTLYEPRGV